MYVVEQETGKRGVSVDGVAVEVAAVSGEQRMYYAVEATVASRYVGWREHALLAQVLRRLKLLNHVSI